MGNHLVAKSILQAPSISHKKAQKPQKKMNGDAALRFFVARLIF
jgi:hypothetical protein